MDTIDTNHQPQNRLTVADIAQLHGKLFGMFSLITRQFSDTMSALSEGDVELAHAVIAKNQQVKEFEISVDNEVLAVISQHSPTEPELRAIVATSKIVSELEKIGDEISDFSELIIVLYDPNTSDPNQNLLKDIIKIGELVKIILDKLLLIISQWDSKPAYTLLQSDRDCELELQEGIKHQLDMVVHNIRMIRRALDILQMMKSLERCGEHCRNIAEFLILMIDGLDVRHNR